LSERRHKRSHRGAVALGPAGLVVTLLLAGALSCSPVDSTDAPEVKCYWDTRLSGSSGDAPEVAESQIFLDLSRTMSGFISEGRSGRPVTLQQELLRTILLEALGNVAVTPPTLWGFGREVFPLEGSLSSYAAKEGRGSEEPWTLYDQAETDVVGALLAASRQPAALSVILTDNAQDLRTPKDRRAPGFDRSAMGRALTEELAGNGFGVWLIGFRNDFRGAYFSILLASNSHGIHVNKPIPLASKQPLYAWVLSRDLPKGRAVVDHLVRELRRRWRVRNGEGEPPVHAVELAPGAPPDVLPLEPLPDELEVVASDDPVLGNLDPTRDVLRVQTWGPEDGEPPRAAGTLTFQRPRGVDLFFLIKAQLEPNGQDRQWGGWPFSAWHLKWQIQPNGQGPSGKVEEDLAPFRGEHRAGTRFRRLVMPFDQLVAYDPPGRRVEIPLSLTFDADAIPGDHWLQAWSTDDDTTKEGIEGKTLYLFDVARSVLERTIGRERPAACLHLTLVEE